MEIIARTLVIGLWIAVLVSWEIAIVYGCDVTLSPLYSSVSSNVTFRFNRINPSPSDIYRVLYDLSGSDLPILEISYTASGTGSVQTIAGITFTGDTQTGDITFVYRDVPDNRFGVYSLKIRIGIYVPVQCITLYNLGTPTTPTVSVNQNPDVGGTVTLGCNGSTSTTSPTGHGLSMKYSWKINGTINPVDSRYTYSSSKHQLTISPVQSNDASQQFTCQTMEDVAGGLTSASSSQTSFYVYYGPDNISFIPKTTVYDVSEGTILDPIRCTADCYPTCLYVCVKSGQSEEIGTDGTLNLGFVQSNTSGIYTCTATSTGWSGIIRATATKDLTINVIYGPRNIVLSPARSTYREAEGFSMPVISCSSECYECTYSWSGPIAVASGRQLTFSTLSKSANGTFMCTVRNVKSQTTQLLTTSVVMEVKYGPTEVNLTPITTEYTRDADTVLSDILCSSDCYPACSHIWTHANQTSVSGNGRLHFGTLHKGSAGLYTCTATNPEIERATKTATVRIHIRYGPESIVLNPILTTYTENEDTTLQVILCSDSCYPNCTYTWTRAGSHDSLSANGSLSLDKLSRNEAGYYTCTATNQDRTSSPQTQKTITVIVRYGPDSVQINKVSPYIVTEGTTGITIDCSSDCYPICSFYWTNMTGNSIIGSDAVSSIAKATRYDAGIYRCISYNSASQYNKTASSTVTVVVHYVPDVCATLSNQDFVENSPNQVRCTASGIPSTYHYQQIRQTTDGKVIPHNHTYVPGLTGERILDIPSLQLQDTGTYRCQVNNGIKDNGGQLDQTDYVDLLVHVSPKILTKTFLFASSHGESVNITIPFYCYPAISSVILMRPDKTVVTDDKRHTLAYPTGNVRTQFYGVDVTLVGNIFQLYVTNLQDKDFTNYSLRLQNDVGQVEIDISFVAESKPIPPQAFRFLGLIERVPQFYWKKGFNGGHKQYFVIETAPFGTQDWAERIHVDEDDSRFYFQPMQSSIANITGLSPGQYWARLIAGNKLGLTEESTWLQTTFTIPNHEIEEDKHSQLFGAIIGGVGASIFVIVCVAVALICILKRRNANDSASHNNAVHLSDPSSQYTTLADSDATTNTYDTLQDIELQETRPTTKVYENLKI